MVEKVNSVVDRMDDIPRHISLATPRRKFRRQGKGDVNITTPSNVVTGQTPGLPTWTRQLVD
jgi:hypothetical protein